MIADIQRQKTGVAWLSVISNSALVISKIFIGLWIGSVSVISEGIHSAVDLLASFIALYSVKTSGKPADREHPFGHGKVENISGAVEALLIFIAAGWIIYEAIDRLQNPKPLAFVGWGIAVMFISSAVNIIVSHMLFKVGEATDSIALQADAWHLRTDVYTSAGVMFGLGLIWSGRWILPETDLHWLDPAIAIAVALMIIRAAYRLTIHSIKDLIDASLPSHERETIKDMIKDMSPKVHGFHKLLTRKAGNTRFVEFHMKVDPHMTVEHSHGLAETISSTIKERFPGAHVTVHIEPCEGWCDIDCREGCLLPEENGKIPQLRITMSHLKVSGNIVDVTNNEIYPGTLTISDGTIRKISREHTDSETFIIPGFIDSHIHIESSMLTPSEFARISAIHGTIAAVCDPHEIANVLGMRGIDYMIEDAQRVPVKFYFNAPSCVPATTLETSGDELGAEKIETLLKRAEILGLGEVMNFPGVINNDPDVMKKIESARK
ncbi:MAG: cation diffusion facilitator family transporter, partial [Deltaproteobacteria bacterium]|nr:cation diffusion facilitator family transporter [Deltaproteobacteria bacterium]